MDEEKILNSLCKMVSSLKNKNILLVNYEKYITDKFDIFLNKLFNKVMYVKDFNSFSNSDYCEYLNYVINEQISKADIIFIFENSENSFTKFIISISKAYDKIIYGCDDNCEIKLIYFDSGIRKDDALCDAYRLFLLLLFKFEEPEIKELIANWMVSIKDIIDFNTVIEDLKDTLNFLKGEN